MRRRGVRESDRKGGFLLKDLESFLGITGTHTYALAKQLGIRIRRQRVGKVNEPLSPADAMRIIERYHMERGKEIIRTAELMLERLREKAQTEPE